MPFYTKRLQADDEAAARARGEIVDYLIDDAPNEFRVQLWFAIQKLQSDVDTYSLLPRIRHFLCEEYGRFCLSEEGNPHGRRADGTRVVHVVTADPAAAACPGCGVVSTSGKQMVVTRPRDIPYGADAVELVWHKQRWRCKQENCPTESFTESVPQVPPRRRTTSRLRQAAAQAVASNRSVAEVAAEHRLGWATVQTCVDELADLREPLGQRDRATRAGQRVEDAEVEQDGLGHESPTGSGGGWFRRDDRARDRLRRTNSGRSGPAS